MRRNLVAILSALALTAAATAGASPSSPGTVELNVGYAKSSEDMGGGETMGGGIAFGAAY